MPNQDSSPDSRLRSNRSPEFSQGEEEISVWASIEQAAFAQYPDIQRVLAEATAETLVPPPGRGSLFSTGFLLLIAKLGPVWCFAGLVTHYRFPRYPSVETLLTAVVVLSVLYLASLLGAWKDLSRGEVTLEGRMELRFALGNAVVATLSALLIPPLWSSGAIAVAAFWAAVACVLASLVTAAWLMADARRSRNGDMSGYSAFERSRAAVDALTPQQQAWIKSSVDAQIDALAAQGRIGMETAVEAKQQRLGTLGRWAVARELYARSRAGHR